MTTSVYLNEALVCELDRIAKQEDVSRSEIVHRIVEDYLARRRDAVLSEAFGSWSKRKVDGLEYQERLREEWERPDEDQTEA